MDTGLGETWEMYAHRDGKGGFRHVFGRKAQVAMTGPAEIVPVTVTIVPEPDNTHWAWLDYVYGEWNNLAPTMIWESLFQLEMCFTYGMQAEIDLGRGIPVTLLVQERTK